MRRRSPAATSVVVATSLLAVPACALLVDLDGLGASATTPDSAAAAAPDGAGEASPGDVGVVDAGYDGSWCEAFAEPGAFCDDFDAPGRTDPSAGWNGGSIGGGGTVSLVDGGTSAPRAVQIRWSAGVKPPQGDCNYQRINRFFPQFVRSFTLSYDVRIGGPDGTAFYDDAIAAVVLDTRAGTSCELIWTPRRSGSSLEGVETYFAVKSTPYGRWHRVQISVDNRGPTPGTLTMSIDGEPIFAPQVLPQCTGEFKVSLLQGLFCAKNNPGETLLEFDNVLYTSR